MLLKGKNFRIILHKKYQNQIDLATHLRQGSFIFYLVNWLREYAATLVVAFCVLLVALLNIASVKSLRGTPFSFLSSKNRKSAAEIIRNKVITEKSKKNNLAMVTLSNTEFISNSSKLYEDISLYEVADYYEPAYNINSQIISALSGPQMLTSSKKREIKIYEVKSGDTISSIAAANGITTNTVLWANNLSETSMIKPGDKLTILPVTGIKYKVQKSDSLDIIAKKYNADKSKVIAYNQLTADEKIKEGQELIIPDGYISAPQPVSTSPTRLAYGSSYAANTYRMDGRAGAGHRFPYGYCTWYVAQRKYIPWGGNAGSWLANARAAGRATGRTPQAGAIIVTGESRWGHVGIVEKVNGNIVTISEMNYVGFGKKSVRTLNASSRIVKGFIY